MDPLKDAFIDTVCKDMVGIPEESKETKSSADPLKDSFVGEAIKDLNGGAPADNQKVNKSLTDVGALPEGDAKREHLLNNFAESVFSGKPTDQQTTPEKEVNVESVKSDADKESQSVLRNLLKGLN